MVERGWHTHVLGDARQFASAEEAVKTYRDELKVIDQDLPAFVIAEDGKPVGTVEDGDSVIFFNFRGDRAIEISKAFDAPAGEFDKFDRVRVPAVVYAGMLEYDGDLHIPSRYLVSPPEITNTMSEYLTLSGVKQLAISETQKYGHVTYFWNGNRSGKFSEELETYIEIPSDVVPFEQRPWMKCAEITDKLIECLESGEYKYLRVNFPNGDMVGHTGSLLATRCSMEALDLQLARILKVLDKVGGIALITADHGNADEMYEMDKKSGQPKADKNGNYKAKTSHTLNPVPCIIYDNVTNGAYTVKADEGKFGLSNVAATMVNLLGYEAPAMWDESIINVK
jgi:2,3-bisphosphoglycerate-independent phosphoglycerate mutase